MKNLEQEQVELSLTDVVKISDAAKEMGCTVESLLREAGDSKRLLYVALKPCSAKLVATPSHPTPRQGHITTRAYKIIAMLPQYAESLVIAGEAEIVQYQAHVKLTNETDFEIHLDWHYWVLDVPQMVNVDRVYVPRSQLPVIPANAPIAKSEAISTVGTPVPERIPVSKQQETEILSWLTSNNHNPLELPIAPMGKAGVKSECRKVLCMRPTALFSSKRTFNTAWQRLRDNDAIKDEKK